MTKLKKVLFGVIGLFIAAALPLAYAQNAQGPDEGFSKKHADQRIQEIFNQLNLTDDQKNQLEANKKEHRERMESSRQEMKIYKEEFQEELMKPQINMSKVRDLHNKMKVVESHIEDDKLSSILAVRKILTSGQFAKFVSLMHQHK